MSLGFNTRVTFCPLKLHSVFSVSVGTCTIISTGPYMQEKKCELFASLQKVRREKKQKTKTKKKQALSGDRTRDLYINPPHLTAPHPTPPHLTSPHLTSPHLTSPHLTSPHHTTPHLTPHLTSRSHLTHHTTHKT